MEGNNSQNPLNSAEKKERARRKRERAQIRIARAIRRAKRTATQLSSKKVAEATTEFRMSQPIGDAPKRPQIPWLPLYPPRPPLPSYPCVVRVKPRPQYIQPVINIEDSTDAETLRSSYEGVIFTAYLTLDHLLLHHDLLHLHLHNKDGGQYCWGKQPIFHRLETNTFSTWWPKSESGKSCKKDVTLLGAILN